MFQTLRLPHVFHGVRPSMLQGLAAMEDAAPQNEGVFDRLLSRAELELSDPNAVRRRDTIAQLKLAAASTKQGTSTSA